MPTPPERSRRAGPRPDTHSRAEFAAAFLRRNRRYRADHASMVHRIAEGAVSEQAAQAAFAHRWGLSFRLCAR
ncbi:MULTISPECIES: transcriptional regulator domain-containing protein [Sphingobium]|uniref:transcriptional regulator domain-containing protein n=1 Tax=Sphingobium TaxID=165695 RepID=UPI0009FF54AD|nr:DUF6499 domain-containing protein [Sphingobium cloacae]